MIPAARIIMFLFLSTIAAFSLAFGGNNKIKVEKVEFEGNTVFSDSRLERLMLTRSSRFLSPSYYYPEVLEDDLENIIIFYQQNGYLEAMVSDYLVTIDSTTLRANIRITVEEGVLTTVGGVTVFGNTLFDDSTLFKKIKLTKGDPFKRGLIRDDQLTILSIYAEEGYLDASVRPDIKLNPETHVGFVDYVITEHNRFHIGEIIITGSAKTRPYVILRELLFKSGETIKYSLLLESQRRLYLTGLFESVFIRPQVSAAGDSSAKDILIELKENLSSEFNVSLGYGSEDKARTRVEVVTSNLVGTARKAGLNLSASFIRRSIEASFTEPRTFGTKWRTDVNSIFEYLEEPGYDVSSFEGRLTFGRSLGKFTNLNIAFKYEDARLRHVAVAEDIKTIDPRTRSIVLSLFHDTRDNLFDPRTGLYFEFTNEFAAAFLSGNNTFSRSIIDLKKFYEWNHKTVLASALEVGWIKHLGDLEEIPLNERFYAGGANSIRGFGYQLVGPLDENDIPQGGKFKIVWNVLEVRRALFKMFGAVLFVDLGNIWHRPDDFKINTLRIACGAGLRASSPIGILRLDYGINLDPTESEANDMVHFSMGHTF